MPAQSAVARSLSEIRDKAKEFRSFGLETPALSLEWAADLVGGAMQSETDRLVYLPEAAKLSGFCPGHLARLVRTGKIPDQRPAGSRGRILVRVSDLPIKPRAAHTPDADARDLASRLFTKRQGGHHGPS